LECLACIRCLTNCLIIIFDHRSMYVFATRSGTPTDDMLSFMNSTAN